MDTDNNAVKAWVGGKGSRVEEVNEEEKGGIYNTLNNKINSSKKIMAVSVTALS